jgi:segregation and condensation protein B
MSELKKKVEAVLFSVGRKASLEELGKICKCDEKDLKKELNSLKQDYDNNDTSLMIIEEGDNWKFAVREDYLSLVRKVVTETELSKTIMETLAIIAFKSPVKQSDVIKVRTNKAYDHLSELESAGYITRERYGRTKLIKLSQKFFDYFDIPPDKLKQKFKKFEDVEKAIISKEEEIEKQKSEIDQKKKEMAEKIKQQSENKQLDNLDTYDAKPEENKLGDLEVFEEEKPKEKKQEEETVKPDENVDFVLENEKDNEESIETEQDEPVEENDEDTDDEPEKDKEEKDNDTGQVITERKLSEKLESELEEPEQEPEDEKD